MSIRIIFVIASIVACSSSHSPLSTTEQELAERANCGFLQCHPLTCNINHNGWVCDQNLDALRQCQDNCGDTAYCPGDTEAFSVIDDCDRFGSSTAGIPPCNSYDDDELGKAICEVQCANSKVRLCQAPAAPPSGGGGGGGGPDPTNGGQP